MLHWANGQVVQKSGNASLMDSNNASVPALNLWLTAAMLVYLYSIQFCVKCGKCKKEKMVTYKVGLLTVCCL